MPDPEATAAVYDLHALDFNLGCSGYFYELSFAKGLVCVGVAKNVLLLTGETYSKYLAYALAVTLVLAAALKFCSGRVSRLVGIGR